MEPRLYLGGAEGLKMVCYGNVELSASVSGMLLEFLPIRSQVDVEAPVPAIAQVVW